MAKRELTAAEAAEWERYRNCVTPPGDRAAFDAAIAPHWDALSVVARARLKNPRQRQDADDAVQKAVTRLWENRAFPPAVEGSLRAWLRGYVTRCSSEVWSEAAKELQACGALLDLAAGSAPSSAKGRIPQTRLRKAQDFVDRHLPEAPERHRVEARQLKLQEKVERAALKYVESNRLGLVGLPLAGAAARLGLCGLLASFFNHEYERRGQPQNLSRGSTQKLAEAAWAKNLELPRPLLPAFRQLYAPFEAWVLQQLKGDRSVSYLLKWWT